MVANPWLILAATLALGGALGGSYLKGRTDGRAITEARQIREDAIRQETLRIAMDGAAMKIAEISINHTTIRQRAETITREVPVYRDCLNDPAVVQLLDNARSNAASKPAGGGVMPRTRTDFTP